MIQSAWQLSLDWDATPVVVEPSAAQISSDAGLLPFRQLDEQLGLTQQGQRKVQKWPAADGLAVARRRQCPPEGVQPANGGVGDNRRTVVEDEASREAVPMDDDRRQ